MKLFKDFKIVLLLCLTLGLAPFFPEPHIWGKLKWLWGGAEGMQPIDWFDLLLHGSPFILLIWLIILNIVKNNGA
ncbi:hypothetical protein [Hyunsoonleella aestuarii]|uniref:RND transporter n=1 Tax=Hyunsoonleella aestuarii TaxID=912802 RepID=A0ABP8EEM1_9FLAO|nr:hypothetical protein [Hyunsoonleella aestuarii]